MHRARLQLLSVLARLFHVKADWYKGRAWPRVANLLNTHTALLSVPMYAYMYVFHPMMHTALLLVPMYVCKDVCMYVFMYKVHVCMHVCMYVCMCACIFWSSECLYVCLHVCIDACIYSQLH